MRRRDFVAGTALTLGLARVNAQTPASLQRIAWLLTSPPDRPQAQWAAFPEALGKLGWIEGKNVQIERRYLGDLSNQAVTLEERAKEIVALSPDVIFTGTSPAVDAVLRETKTIPIV